MNCKLRQVWPSDVKVKPSVAEWFASQAEYKQMDYKPSRSRAEWTTSEAEQKEWITSQAKNGRVAKHTREVK